MRVFPAMVLMAALTVVAVVGGGCQETPKPPEPKVARELYTGPLHKLSQVLMVLGQRSNGVRTLWCRHDFAVSVRDGKGNVRTLDGDGVLLLRKPEAGTSGVTEIRLTGSKDIAGQVFDLGASKTSAWLTLLGDIDTMWYFGTTDPAALARIDPAIVPVRPDLLADLLGVQDWSTDTSRWPVPVMTYDAEGDEYVLTLVEPPAAPNGASLITRRQVHVARTNLVIRSITFYGVDGRPVATSMLDKWQALAGAPAGTIVPTDITLLLPLSKANLRLTLRDVATRKGNLPADISFKFPEKAPAGKVIRLDEPTAPAVPASAVGGQSRM
jgi:hypothetical protein